jgi:hypothetical protein
LPHPSRPCCPSVELSKEKLELEYVLKQQNSELEKIRPESSFYKNSMSELQELLRVKDKERYQLEQDLARSTARREALELQISDKEEVELCHSFPLSLPHFLLSVSVKIVQKSTSLRNASEQSRQDALKQVEVYSTALSALQEKFKAAVNEINKGNEVKLPVPTHPSPPPPTPPS